MNNLNIKLLFPYLVGSIPFSYIGGSLHIEKQIFEVLLFIILAAAGTLLLFNFKSYDDKEENYRKIPIFISIFIGSLLGFISGVVGIGGGIFLSPILFLLRAADPKKNYNNCIIIYTYKLFSRSSGSINKRECI